MLTPINSDLPRTAPEQQGVSSSAILDFVQAVETQIHDLHSFVLLRHGHVIAEGWWGPYRRDDPHLLFSVSKSFTSTAVGLAVSEGHFSLDDSVLSFFPDDAPADPSVFLAAMRVRHLLSMSTGHTDDTWAYMSGQSDPNWIKAFFGVPVLHQPGTHFLYNTGATYMLSAIVQKTTGMKLVEYLQSRLFAPLGITQATWETSPQGINLGGIGLSLKTEDLARFGQLYLQNGMWQGQQILPPEWVKEATSTQMSNGEGGESDWTQGYGYQFWRCRHGAYRADGVFGQYCVIMPEQDAVLAITGGIDVFDAQQPLDLLWTILLPAMSQDPLPEDASTYQRLTEKLSALSLLPVQGKATSLISSDVSDRIYRVDANELGVESIIPKFTETGCVFTLKTASGDEVIPCGYGVWQRGQTRLLTRESASTAASGAWTAEETFTMIVRLTETPFYYTLVFEFIGDELMIESRVNASLDSLRPLVLTAQMAEAQP